MSARSPWINQKPTMLFPSCKQGKAHYYTYKNKKNICKYCGFDYDKFQEDLKKSLNSK